MEHHTYRGVTPSHGFKVGIGSLASLALYEALMAYDVAKLDIEAAVERLADDRGRTTRKSPQLFEFARAATKGDS